MKTKYEISPEEYRKSCEVMVKRIINTVQHDISIIISDFKGEEPNNKVRKEMFPFQKAKLSKYLLSKNSTKEEIENKLFGYFRSQLDEPIYKEVKDNVDPKYSKEMCEIVDKAVKKLERIVQ